MNHPSVFAKSCSVFAKILQTSAEPNLLGLCRVQLKLMQSGRRLNFPKEISLPKR